MRLRKIKEAKDEIEKSNYYVLNPSKNKGKWNKIFGNNNPIYIEIGMGKGKFIRDNAIKYPNINFRNYGFNFLTESIEVFLS